MNWRDKEKLIKRGFIILRERDYFPIVESIKSDRPYRIAFCSKVIGWSVYKNHKYYTNAERRRAMDELLKEDHIIED